MIHRVLISFLKRRARMPQTLAFGLFSLNSGACSYPATAARVALAAEAAGFDSLWAGEHVVRPDPRVPPSPLAPEERILDPIVTLSFLAAQTKRVLPGKGWAERLLLAAHILQRPGNDAVLSKTPSFRF